MRFRAVRTEEEAQQYVGRSAEKLRAARVAQARKNAHWTELDAVDFVPRGPARFGWLVSATTDALFKPYRGALWVGQR